MCVRSRIFTYYKKIHMSSNNSIGTHNLNLYHLLIFLLLKMMSSWKLLPCFRTDAAKISRPTTQKKKKKSVIAVQCMCVNRFLILMPEITNKTVHTLDSYLICLINTHISNVYRFSGPCYQNLVFTHLAKY